MPAMMCKVVEPCAKLYEILSISDADIAFANTNFAKRNSPYRLIRSEQVAVKQHS